MILIPLPFLLIQCRGFIVQDVLFQLKPGRCQLMAIFQKISSWLCLKATLLQTSLCLLSVIQSNLSPGNFIAILKRGLAWLPQLHVT